METVKRFVEDVGHRPTGGRRPGAPPTAADGQIADFWINRDELGTIEQLEAVRRAETANV